MWHNFFVNLWLKIFGTLTLGGINIGFWFSALICVLLVVAMNLVFWLIKPNAKATGTFTEEKEKHERQ